MEDNESEDLLFASPKRKNHEVESSRHRSKETESNNTISTKELLEIVNNDGPTEKKVELKKQKRFTCLVCGKNFSQNAGRYIHMKKIHNVHPEEKSNVRCLEKGCSFACCYKEKLQLHLSVDHGIEMDVAVKTFGTLQDFMRWKDEFERQEKSRFVKKSGSRVREEGIRVAYYYCSRSGTYVSNSKGVKKSKKKGTSKSSNHCTASITCIELPDGKVEVKVCSTHYGHDSDLQHLRLTQTEKFQIAEQLCRGVPPDLVLDNVRASAGLDVDRIHLITMKDVKNIEKSYGIQTSSNEKTNNMFFNLNVWLTTILQTENCPVLYFNEEGKYNTKSHDITLVLLAKGQLEVLNKYGSSGIFYVTSFVTKSNKGQPSLCQYIKPSSIYVTTLMVIDEVNEAVPVGFMVTNKDNISKYTLFFESLKKKVPDISALALLTDDKKEIYDVWCAVFKDNPHYLWSNRFVDSDWRVNLILIPDEEVQVSIYEKMYSFLESTDKEKLESTLHNYVCQLQDDPATEKFGNYLASKYLGSESMWAGCYGKKLVVVSAQLNMENFCNELEEIGSKRHWDRNFLVRIVQSLLKLFSDKQCVRQAKLQQQIQELSTHHQLALNTKPEAITAETTSWRINSAKDPLNIFSVVKQQISNCEPPLCVLYCSKCTICAHQFNCSCRVYSFDRTMCKHIHAVGLKYFQEHSVFSDELQERDIKAVELQETNKVLVNEGLWQKTKELTRKKRVADESTSEENMLPAIEEVLRNQVETGKKDRCKQEPTESENGVRKKRKYTKRQKPTKVTEENSLDSVRCRKINILRKSVTLSD